MGVPKKDKNSNNNIDLPDGWLPCDGRAIENGPWAGGMTPNLNSNGHFLRGGDENNVFDFEEDQIPPHTHPYSDSGNHPGSTQCAKEPFNGGILLNQKTLYATERQVSINSAESNIGGVTNDYRNGIETRPKNM